VDVRNNPPCLIEIYGFKPDSNYRNFKILKDDYSVIKYHEYDFFKEPKNNEEPVENV
jgi:hypothetical protein